LSNSQNYLSDDSVENQTNFSYEAIDNLIFEKITYSPTNSGIEYSLSDFEALQLIDEQDLIDYNYENKSEYTTFIKSDYSEASGVKIQKIFSDVNG
jgi:hypothetical protein